MLVQVLFLSMTKDTHACVKLHSICATQLKQTTGQQGHRQLSPLADVLCDLLDYIISCSLEGQTLHLNNAIASKA